MAGKDSPQKKMQELLKLQRKIKKLQDELESMISESTKLTDKLTIPPESKIILSCDGSIVKNPGGPSAIGALIEQPGQKPIEIARGTPAITNNEAEMDAVYTALYNLSCLNPCPKYEIEVHSDSRIVVDGLNKKSNMKAVNLIKKRDIILETAGKLPVKVTFIWKRRNSTWGLATANRLAQQANGVKVH